MSELMQVFLFIMGIHQWIYSLPPTNATCRCTWTFSLNSQKLTASSIEMTRLFGCHSTICKKGSASTVEGIGFSPFQLVYAHELRWLVKVMKTVCLRILTNVLVQLFWIAGVKCMTNYQIQCRWPRVILLMLKKTWKKAIFHSRG